MDISCPICQFKAYKNRKTKGRQRYWCDRCNFNFGEFPTRREIAIRELEKLRRGQEI